MIGRIGAGPPDLSGTADGAGELSLGVNDMDPNDNAGSFVALIDY